VKNSDQLAGKTGLKAERGKIVISLQLAVEVSTSFRLCPDFKGAYLAVEGDR